MDRLGARIVPSLLTLSLVAGTSPALAELEDPGTRDRPPVSIVIEPTAALAMGVGAHGNALLLLTAHADTAPLLLTIQTAGAVEVPEPAGWQRLPPAESLIADLPARDQFALRLDGFTRRDVKVIELPLSFPAAGYGYLLATVRSPAEGEPLRFSESFVVYTLAAPQRVYFSPRSKLELEIQELRAEVAVGGFSEADEDEIQKLKRRGAVVELKEQPPAMEPGAAAAPAAPAAVPPPSMEAENAAAPPLSAPTPAPAPKSIAVAGRIAFQDMLGRTHPVRDATVQVWDQEAGKDQLVKTTSTDRNGDYSVAIDNNDGDGTGRDVYIIALAQGDAVSVVDFNDPQQVWAIDSLPARKNTPDGTQLTITLSASNDLARPNNVAFEAYEAANVLSRYLVALGEKLPAPVKILYPGAGDGSSYQGSNIALAGTDVHDWDNIHHEYGHHIQELYNLSASPGGPHAPGENLCASHGKKNGLRLAWGEAWATFFGVLAQQEMSLSLWGIPFLGDTSYTDTKPGGDDLEYDLEISDGTLSGEGDELSVQDALWDLYDPSNDPGDAGVALSARALWDVVTRAEAHTLSDFHRALIAGRSDKEQMDFGAIYAHHKIGSELIAPDDESEFLVSMAPEFEWAGNLGCDSNGKALYSVRFYDKTGTKLLHGSEWQEASRFAIAQAQAAVLQAEPGTRWVVASKGLDDPETGIYYGQSRTFRAKAGEPQPPIAAEAAESGEPNQGLFFWFPWRIR